MKILFLTQWFQPEPFYKGVSFVKALIQRGHEVQVLTGFPNYPVGKIYPGYKGRWFQREMMDGIEVLRVPLYPSHDTSALGRIANYLSFAFSASILGPWVMKKADVVYVYNPPPTACLPAVFIKLFRRVPLVYDIQDFWPDSLEASGMFTNKFGLGAVDFICRLFYKAANKIVVLSPGFKHKLIEKGVPTEKIEIIYNWGDDGGIAASQPDSKLAEKLGMAGRFNILFAGNMGQGQALEFILDAAKILEAKYPKIQFVFIGDGLRVDFLRAKSSQLKLSNVIFHGRKTSQEITSIFQISDVLLVHLKDIPLYTSTIPSKTQAYLAAGKPILMGVRGDAADLVEKAGAGLRCEPENALDVANQVEKLYLMPSAELDKMGRRGAEYYQNELTFLKGVERFERVFQRVIHRVN